MEYVSLVIQIVVEVITNFLGGIGSAIAKLFKDLFLVTDGTTSSLSMLAIIVFVGIGLAFVTMLIRFILAKF